MMGTTGVALIALICNLAPLYIAHNPLISNLRMRLAAPDWFSKGWTGNIFGCDPLGRDVLTRVLMGGRVSLLIAFTVVFFTAIIGAVIGLVSGYFGGLVDSILCRIGDIFMSVPTLLLAVCIVAVLGNSFFNLIITMLITSWVVAARCVRGVVFTVKNQEFIQAERVLGASTARILFKQVFPNTLTPLIIQETQHFGGIVLMESAMSFLGLGIPYPTPSWGNMIADGRDYITQAPWVVMVPGIALMLTVLAFNFFGDGLRDILDPKNTD